MNSDEYTEAIHNCNSKFISKLHKRNERVNIVNIIA